MLVIFSRELDIFHFITFNSIDIISSILITYNWSIWDAQGKLLCQMFCFYSLTIKLIKEKKQENKIIRESTSKGEIVYLGIYDLYFFLISLSIKYLADVLDRKQLPSSYIFDRCVLVKHINSNQHEVFHLFV